MKKITRRSFITVCGAAAAAMALTACGGAASSTVASSAAESTSSSAAAETAAGTLSGNVATGGSTSMKNVIAALTEGFAEVEPGVTVSYDPTGSGAGITGATDKTLDIGLSSRALKDDEKNDVDGTTVALDYARRALNAGKHVVTSNKELVAAYGYELRLQAALSEIWAHLAAQAHPRPGTEEKAATAAQKKLKQMMVYVNAHYAEKITVPMLAAAAYCSERECYRTFQSCLHTSPTDYIRTVRLQSACKMLLETDRTVTDIAQSCGFGTSSYFGMQLHAETGCTPTEYRAKWQNVDT